MQTKLQVVDKKIVLAAPSTKSLTNTIVDAVDSVSTSSDMYVHVNSATVRDDYDSIIFKSDSSITIDVGMKYVCGIPLSNSDMRQHSLYSVYGASKFYCDSANATVLPYFIFGRLLSSTVTASDAAASNQCTTSIIISNSDSKQGLYSSISAGVYFANAVQNDVVVVNSSDSYPVFFGLVLENQTAGAVNIKYLHAFLNIRSSNKGFPVFMPTGS